MTKKKNLGTYYVVSNGETIDGFDTYIYTKEDLLKDKDHFPEGDDTLWEIKVVRKCKISLDIITAE